MVHYSIQVFGLNPRDTSKVCTQNFHGLQTNQTVQLRVEGVWLKSRELLGLGEAALKCEENKIGPAADAKFVQKI